MKYIFIDFDGVGVLIDCGISKKQLIYRMSLHGYDIKDIKYVLLTHDHYDHSKNIHCFDIIRAFNLLQILHDFTFLTRCLSIIHGYNHIPIVIPNIAPTATSICLWPSSSFSFS